MNKRSSLKPLLIVLLCLIPICCLILHALCVQRDRHLRTPSRYVSASPIVSQQIESLMDHMNDPGSSDSDAELRDYWGGVFINIDQNLVIYSTCVKREIRDAFVRAAGSNDVIILKCDFTERELRAATQLVNEAGQNGLLQSLNIAGWGPDTSKNRVVVYMTDPNEQMRKRFLEVMSHADPRIFEFAVGTYSVLA